MKDLVTRELLEIDLSKQQQSSDWAAEDALSEAQLAYAASDVLHLHGSEGQQLECPTRTRRARRDLAEACFEFLPAQGAELDLARVGQKKTDIFAH